MDDWLDVSWGHNAADSGPSVARVAVRVKNEPGSLAAVMTVIAANGGNIFNMKVTGRNPLFFEFIMDIEVRDVGHLQNIVGALRVNNAVESVDRVREAEGEFQLGGEKRLNVEQVLNEFKKSGAFLEGHFILSSGLHSDKFLQKALVFQDAKRTAKLCKALAAKVKKEVKDEITAIVSPAVGGIVPGYEMGRQLGVPAMWVERVDGVFQLRRNFSLKKGQKVLMVEDIVSTGVSSRECIAAIKATGAKVVAACCLIDRSGRQGQGRRAVDRAGGMESVGLAGGQAAAASAQYSRGQTGAPEGLA